LGFGLGLGVGVRDGLGAAAHLELGCSQLARDHLPRLYDVLTAQRRRTDGANEVRVELCHERRARAARAWSGLGLGLGSGSLVRVRVRVEVGLGSGLGLG
jgi:hypothetical protein